MTSLETAQVAVATACVLLLVSGCSSDDKSTGDTNASAVASSPTEKPPTSQSTKPTLPRGMKWIESTAGVQFAAPKSWTELSGSTADDPAHADEIAELADASGVTIEEMKESIRTVDVRANHPSSGVNVALAKVPEALPTAEQLEDLLRATPITENATVDDVDTVFGPGLVVRNETEFRGVLLHFLALYFVTPSDQTVSITVTGPHPDAAAEQYATVVSTLSEIG